jgi:type IV pilus assembly protein PilB
MTQSFEEKLCTILVKNKVITPKESADLQKDFAGRTKENFDDFLLSEGVVQKDDLLQALSECYEVPAFDIVGHFFKRDLLLQFPKDFLVRHGIIPLERDGNMLVIVASEPDNTDFLAEMSDYVSDDTRFFVGIRQEIIDAVDEYYEESPFSSDGEIDPSDELHEDAKLIEDTFDE